MTPKVTVWFDSQCPLCRREIAVIRRLDRRKAIRFIDLHDADAACPIDRQALLDRFHAEDAAGRLHSGAAAFAAMWRAIPLLSPLGRVAGWPPATPLFEAAYRRFLKIRPRLQRLLGSA